MNMQNTHTHTHTKMGFLFLDLTRENATRTQNTHDTMKYLRDGFLLGLPKKATELKGHQIMLVQANLFAGLFSARGSIGKHEPFANPFGLEGMRSVEPVQLGVGNEDICVRKKQSLRKQRHACLLRPVVSSTSHNHLRIHEIFPKQII